MSRGEHEIWLIECGHYSLDGQHWPAGWIHFLFAMAGTSDWRTTLSGKQSTRRSDGRTRIQIVSNCNFVVDDVVALLRMRMPFRWTEHKHTFTHCVRPKATGDAAAAASAAERSELIKHRRARVARTTRTHIWYFKFPLRHARRVLATSLSVCRRVRDKMCK